MNTIISCQNFKRNVRNSLFDGESDISKRNQMNLEVKADKLYYKNIT